MDDTQDNIDPLTDAVPIRRAQVALSLSRSQIYELAGRGELALVKDGAKTLVTVASIRRRQATRPRVIIKPRLRPNKRAAG